MQSCSKVGAVGQAACLADTRGSAAVQDNVWAGLAASFARLSRPRDRLGGNWKSTACHSSIRVLHSSAKRRQTPAGGWMDRSSKEGTCCHVWRQAPKGTPPCEAVHSTTPNVAHQCRCGAGRSLRPWPALAPPSHRSGRQNRWAAAAGATPSLHWCAMPAAWRSRAPADREVMQQGCWMHRAMDKQPARGSVGRRRRPAAIRRDCRKGPLAIPCSCRHHVQSLSSHGALVFARGSKRHLRGSPRAALRASACPLKLEVGQENLLNGYQGQPGKRGAAPGAEPSGVGVW